MLSYAILFYRAFFISLSYVTVSYALLSVPTFSDRILSYLPFPSLIIGSALFLSLLESLSSTRLCITLSSVVDARLPRPPRISLLVYLFLIFSGLLLSSFLFSSLHSSSRHTLTLSHSLSNYSFTFGAPSSFASLFTFRQCSTVRAQHRWAEDPRGRILFLNAGRAGNRYVGV